MSEPEIANWKAGAHSGRMLAAAGGENYRYQVGYITTPDGTVGVYSEPRATMLTVVSHGREIRGRWARGFSERSLVTMARRFAAEHAGGNHD